MVNKTREGKQTLLKNGYLSITAMVMMVSLFIVGCGNGTISEVEHAAYISVNENSQYEKTFKDLNLGILYDYNLKVNNADKSWVNVWVEGYQNGEKVDPFHLTELSYGQSPNQVNEGSLVFGIINPNSEDASIFISSPSGEVHRVLQPTGIKDGIFKKGMGSTWGYAIGSEPIALESGETKIIGVYRQANSFRTYDYQDMDSIDRMINEDKGLLLLKIKVEERIEP